MRRMALSGTLVAVLLVAATPATAAAGNNSPAGYRPPVDAAITDPFRPPPQPWAPGNRGVEYATVPGTPVLAAADGEVVFAGSVAGGLHVVVLHPDGVRTSYSFLQSMALHRGDRVEQGRPVGTAGARLHFGARLGETYIDPVLLFDSGPPEVYLVPDEVKRPASEERERRGLLEMVKGFGGDLLRAGADGLDWARDTGAAAAQWAGETAVAGGHMAVGELTARWNNLLRQLAAARHYAQAVDPLRTWRRVVLTLPEWWRQQRNCTPEGAETPTPGKGHVAVLVSGFGSSSDNAAVYDVNTMALGYHPADVLHFSYEGGTTAENPFSAADTTVDIRRSARALAELLERTAAEHPGMPIDILAHSQGGLVARAYLAYEFERSRSRPPVSALVTLATPHQGTGLATFGTMLQETRGGQALALGIDAVWHHAMDGPSVKGTSVHQMAEVSRFIAALSRRPLPRGVRVTSISAREDFVVAGDHTRLPEAHHVMVSALGWNAHDRLPGTPDALREVALGLDGRPPTCQSLQDMLFDAAVSEGISWRQDTAAAALLVEAARQTGFSPVHPDDPGGDE